MAQGSRAGAEHAARLQRPACNECQRARFNADGAATSAAGASADEDASASALAHPVSNYSSAARGEPRERQDGHLGPHSTPAGHLSGPAAHAHRV